MQKYYPNYTWLLYGWYSNDWFLPDASMMCTSQNMLKVIDRAIVIRQHRMVMFFCLSTIIK